MHTPVTEAPLCSTHCTEADMRIVTLFIHKVVEYKQYP